MAISEVQNVAPKDSEVDTEETTEEKKVDVNELAAQLEQIKKAQSGSDIAYQKAAKLAEDLRAENDRLKKAGMDAEERAAFEREQADKALTEREAAVNKATLRLSLIEGLGAAEMGTEWGDYVPGANEEEILQNIGKLKELIDKEVGRRVNETLLSNKRPMSGETPAGQAAVDTKGKSFQEIEKLVREGKL